MDTPKTQFLTLPEVAKVIPGKPSIVTCWRWCRRGVRGVKLEYFKAGRKICVTAEGLERFMRELAAADKPLPSKPQPEPALTVTCAPRTDVPNRTEDAAIDGQIGRSA